MSPDEVFLVQVLRALSAVGLEVVWVGSLAAALQGAPVMTQDIDLLVRDTPRNHEKLRAFCAALGDVEMMKISPLSRTLRVVGTPLPIDVMFDEISGNLSFAALRARSVRVPIGDAVATVASLEDVVASKTAAGRPKDRAQLPVLEETLRVKRALEPGG